jgi:hydroxylamine reductase
MTEEKMFCFQCQETAGPCHIKGVCGKESDVANLQYALISVVKGLSWWATKARGIGLTDADVDYFITKGLFSTITNVNFDGDWFVNRIADGAALLAKFKAVFLEAYQEKQGEEFSEHVPEAASTDYTVSKEELETMGFARTPRAVEDEDLRSLREMLTYGLKGMAAYADHALALGFEDDAIWTFMQKALAALLDESLDAETLLALVDECGAVGVTTTALLDKANTTTFGTPEITEVNIGVRDDKPGILVSGHDLLDLYELLQQTEGQGINIYTHGEMLPANAYPKLKAFEHLAGNYGSSWWHQKEDFDTFNGPVLLTTNCLIPPKDTYFDRLYVTGNVGWPGVKVIPDREPGKQKNFSAIIEQAKTCAAPTELESGTIKTGFAHDTVLGVADKVIEAVNSGAIKRFVVMAGCDGRHKIRSYFTDVATHLPEDTVILTAGCAKYRYNKEKLGDISGIPRVLDAGQCNDSYSLVVVALKLAEAFGVESVNDLPLSFDIAWYEQKAVLVLLILLHLGIKNIHLGPTVPAFLSPNIVNVIVDKWNLHPITTPEEDIAAIMNGQ